VKDLNQIGFNKIAAKLQEFMVYSQKIGKGDSYLIVNRNSSVLAKAAKEAAEKIGLKLRTFDLDKNGPYQHFPEELIKLLRKQTPKAGIGLFDYSSNPEWNLKEVGARIELLHETIEKVPISWAHSPGITLDMALNGPLQCNYKSLAEESEKLLIKLMGIKKFHITAPRGTNIEVEVPSGLKFDTDCTIVPPNLYGGPGKFGNLPIGEVWCQKDLTTNVFNKETQKTETRSYPVKLPANGKLVCDITAGGFQGKINPEKPLIANFQDGVLTSLQCDDSALGNILADINGSQILYGLPTVLEEIGIGLNKNARITGNMLEDEKIRGTCHLAPGNIRCHVDMLVENPTIVGYYAGGMAQEIMRKGVLL
jgi:hypothetical protein